MQQWFQCNIKVDTVECVERKRKTRHSQRTRYNYVKVPGPEAYNSTH